MNWYAPNTTAYFEEFNKLWQEMNL
jgi:hypothetical protein